MAQLIDKDAVVAEIERLGEVQPLNEFQPKEQNKIDWLSGKLFAINSLRVFLDTLEVKEVDLEKELNEYGLYYDYTSFDRKEMIDFAKHFFELGMQQSKNDNNYEEKK